MQLQTLNLNLTLTLIIFLTLKLTLIFQKLLWHRSYWILVILIAIEFDYKP